MSYHTGDTICAIGTATGGAARGMIRISGPDAVAVAKQVFDAADGRRLIEETRCCTIDGQLNIMGLSQNHRGLAHVAESSEQNVPVLLAAATLSDKETGYSLPCNLFLWPGRRSYTREPVVEFHTIGSPPLLQAALANVCQNGARLAEPGEFTLRAFLAGRIDLTQAEAVLGVIDARGDHELNVALEQLAGGLAEPLHQLRDGLLQLLAELEAGLDFVEEDIRFISPEDILERLTTARSTLNQIAQQISSRSISRDWPQIVLTGRPNVGKSSLFNALVKKLGASGDFLQKSASAIVSWKSGTTRDYLTAPIVVGNMLCEIVDTAGVDESTLDAVEPIDRAAQHAAIECRRRASIRALCVDSSIVAGISDELATGTEIDCDVILLTKTDLGDPANIEQRRTQLSKQLKVPMIGASSQSGAGLEEFARFIHSFLGRDWATSSGRAVGSTAERCRESVRRATEAIDAAIEITSQAGGDELIAAEIRVAIAELGKMAGAVYTDDLLDRIFRTFCIGK